MGITDSSQIDNPIYTHEISAQLQWKSQPIIQWISINHQL